MHSLSTINEQESVRERIKVLYSYYVIENKLMSQFNFTLGCVKTLINMYPNMGLFEAKVFVDNSVRRTLKA